MPLDFQPRAHSVRATLRPRSLPVREWRRRKVLYTLAACVVMIAAGAGFFLQRGVYATAVGEQRSLALEDGSTVELNSRSRIKVDYSQSERRIDLLEGQALFHVARSANRPFIVRAGTTRVRAIGTAFDVYKAASGTIVTVVEGRVAVMRSARGDGASHKQVVDAGEQLMVTATQTVPAPQPANLATATSWTRRSLVFESSPLTEVAQEFNRYNTRRLVIASRELADFHVSGVFSSVEPTLFLHFLRAQPELVVEETDTEIRIRRK